MLFFSILIGIGYNKEVLIKQKCMVINEMKNNKKYIGIVLMAALLMGSSLGLNSNTVGVFLQPVATGLNESVGAISMHSTIMSLGMAISAFIIPPVLDKLPFRVMISMATLMNVSSIFLMSYVNEAWQLNALGLVRGVSAAFFGIVALQLLINNWFISKHGLVTSIVFSFSGLLGAVFSPVFSRVIQGFGWSTGYQILALCVLLFNAPGILLPYKFYPEDEGATPYQEHEEQSPDQETITYFGPKKPYQFLSVTFFIVMLFSAMVPPLTGLAQHLVGIGLDFSFTATIGAYMISACMVGNITFKLLIGTLSDLKGTVFALLSIIGVVALGLGMIYFSATNLGVIIGSFLYGAIFSIASVGVSLFVKDLYSTSEFPKIFPIINFITNTAGALAVSFFGYSFDFTGSYGFAVLFSIALCIIGSILVLLITKSLKTIQN